LKHLRKLGFTNAQGQPDESQLSADYHVPDAKIIETKQRAKFMDIKFSLEDEKEKLIRYSIYVNDVPLYGAYGRKTGGKIQTLSLTIELTSGENKIEISCMNEKGAESFRALTFARYDKPVKTDLYFIGFGVSRYKDSSINLKYADKDGETPVRKIDKRAEKELFV
jgi:hypothetical protein